ncbi:GntR family transcriptional regulator [Paraburkholderia hospita]|jgi:DNA-binding GntR family transcriptional regulator|uniref:GntR family transcriptional regulator n=1 Tax=Paraburkholderia hospita TaxID=169430 RepID=A0AAJ4VN96_9BURK|nr:GntR family transcriptional regulator [Paraburkholderia hospita]SKD00567.1 transcriptional regulator, GntR family [Burkholderia sp. CF099]SOE83914.1 transcriptional regulator, GntR family [Burkholderia sp. YR290]AUT74100.1 GntR family transcriptional regulator [Paraburkholderia hospita]AXF03731.1 GntR family transcriptional regulator [Paraburkholderia hospita]EIN03013.1 GntR family transcriptional regulator [Paraburkholderia hospita]
MSDALPSLKVERRTTTLRELALEKMRTAILEAHFHPGERLVERSLCEELGVSRTVVREVLRHLETEGLVDSIPNQGPIVALLDSDTAAEIYEIRALLEGDAAMACALRADEAVFARLADCIGSIQQAFERHEHQTVRELTTMFYEQMFHGGGKKVAWEIVQTLNARINRLRAMTIASDDRGRQAVQEMNRILDALRARDAQRARDAATAHVARVADIAAELLRQTVGEASA